MPRWRRLWPEAVTHVSGVAFTIFLSALAVSAQSYYIHLHYPDNPGTRYHLTARTVRVTTNRVSIGTDSTKTDEDGFTAELSADVTILEANRSGWATRKSFIVLSSWLSAKEKQGALLPVGTMVFASIQNGGTIYQVKGKPVDAATTEVLGSLVSLHVAGTDDDELFGVRTVKKVGDRWSANIDSVLKLLSQM